MLSLPSMSNNEIQFQLCYLEITALLHLVGSKNLPFLTEGVRKACQNCRMCAENKPRFRQLPQITPKIFSLNLETSSYHTYGYS